MKLPKLSVTYYGSMPQILSLNFFYTSYYLHQRFFDKIPQPMPC
ncbi:hypothetical protein [Proteiniphilum sp. X52]|nr:hypothetical protein [Proteiniphilum sp. X52]